MREPDYWTCREGEEILACHTIEEAVDDYADHIHPEPMPEEIEVIGFATREATDDWCGSPLDYVLENLDAEFGDPDGGPRGKTARMKVAEATFILAVLSEYSVWACEEVCRKTVKVSEYLDA